ncbi:putative DNA polymerase delta, subunit 4 [Helianthus debilis subsp. tardiflorus]
MYIFLTTRVLSVNPEILVIIYSTNTTPIWSFKFQIQTRNRVSKIKINQIEMASSADMKGFYKQKKKKNAGISKPSSTKSKSKSKNAASFGASVAQPPALVAHGSLDLQENRDANEEVLRQFDMNMMYGPCVGMKRIDRWNRASSLGLSPPDDVYRLLTSAAGEVCADSLWDARV